MLQKHACQKKRRACLRRNTPHRARIPGCMEFHEGVQHSLGVLEVSVPFRRNRSRSRRRCSRPRFPAPVGELDAIFQQTSRLRADGLARDRVLSGLGFMFSGSRAEATLERERERQRKTGVRPSFGKHAERGAASARGRARDFHPATILTPFDWSTSFVARSMPTNETRTHTGR